MIRLVIEDTDVDVLQTETIVGEYAIAPIGDISKRVGAKSIQFKLPKTTTNKALFESSELASSYSNVPYRKLKCRIYVDGVDMQMLFCLLENVDDFYNVRMYGTNSELFYNLKNKRVSELDLRKYNHWWTVDNIIDSFPNVEGYIYSIIDFNDGVSTYMPLTGNTFSPLVLQPSFFKKTILNEIIAQSGLTLIDNIDYINSEPCEVLGCGDFIRDLDGSKYDATFQMWDVDNVYRSYRDIDLNLLPYLYGDDLQFVLTAQNEQYYIPTDLYALGGVRILDLVRIKVKGTFTFKSQGTATPVIIRLSYTADTYGDNIPIEVISETATTSFASYSFDVEINLIPNNFDLLYFGFFIETMGEYIEFDTANTTFEIYDTKIVEPTQISFLGEGGGGGYITIANNLTDTSQGDWISDYLKTYNAVITVDEKNKVCEITPFSNVLKNITNSVDWSGLVDYTNSALTEFDLGLSQRNTFTYKTEKGVIKPFGTDGEILIDNQNLNQEKKYLELLFGASENCVRLDDRNMLNMKIYTTLYKRNTIVPRQFLLNRLTDTIVLEESGTTSFTGSVPYSYFITLDKSYNFGFGNNLIEKYYNAFFGVVDKAKKITCELRLNVVDMANFNPVMPVYIKELDSHFYVSKIKFDYTSRKSSIVELIKLL